VCNVRDVNGVSVAMQADQLRRAAEAIIMETPVVMRVAAPL